MNEVMQKLLFYALLSTLMHSAACVINDMLDCDMDRKVGASRSAAISDRQSFPDGQRGIERTKDRPIASGVITMTEASILLAFLVVVILYVGSGVGTAA